MKCQQLSVRIRLIRLGWRTYPEGSRHCHEMSASRRKKGGSSRGAQGFGSADEPSKCLDIDSESSTELPSAISSRDAWTAAAPAPYHYAQRPRNYTVTCKPGHSCSAHAPPARAAIPTSAPATHSIALRYFADCAFRLSVRHRCPILSHHSARSVSG